MRYIDDEIEHIRSYNSEETEELSLHPKLIENKSQPSIEINPLASSSLSYKRRRNNV